FWGKLNLFASAVELATSAPAGLALWFTILAVAGAINAAIAAAYYLRVVAVMYFQSAQQPVLAGGGWTAHFAAILCAIVVVAVGAWPGRLLDVAIQSEAVLRPEQRTVRTPPDDAMRIAQRNSSP